MFTTGIMKTEQAVIWTELLSWRRSGHQCSATDPIDVENRSQQTADARDP